MPAQREVELNRMRIYAFGEQRLEHRARQAELPRQTLWQMLQATGNRLLALQFTVHTTCISSITYLFPLWVGDLLGWGAREVGVAFGVQGLLMSVFQGVLVGPLTQRLGERSHQHSLEY